TSNLGPAYRVAGQGLRNLAADLGTELRRRTETLELEIETVVPGGRPSRDYVGFAIHLGGSLGDQLRERHASSVVVRFACASIDAPREVRCHPHRPAVDSPAYELDDDDEKDWVRFSYTPTEEEKREPRIVFYLRKKVDVELNSESWHDTLQVLETTFDG